MRYFTLVLALLLVFVLSSSHRALACPTADSDGVVIQKRTVVIVRSGKLAKDLSRERRRAKVSYPIITGGITSPAVLSKIRSLLKVENIFGSSIAEYRQDTWLSAFDYKINYNKNFILDITFHLEGVGAYPDSDDKHLAINLKTGELIKASDVFKTEKLADLATLIDSKLQAEIKGIIKQVNQDKTIDAEERNSVPGLFENLKVEEKDLNDFSIDDKGITFLYDADFAHAVEAYQPVGVYKFTYSELASYLMHDGAPQSLIK